MQLACSQGVLIFIFWGNTPPKYRKRRNDHR